MATPVRTGTQTLAITPEDAYGVLNGPTSFDTALIHWDLDTASLTHQTIENPAVSPDTGEHINGAGLQAPDSKLSFKTFAEGLNIPAGAGETPAVNGMAMLLGSTLGNAPVVYNGDTVKAETTPTVIQVQETTFGAHAANTLVAFKYADGHVEVRPVGDYDALSTGTDGIMDLLMPLSVAPTVAGVIPGGLSVLNSDIADAYTLQAEIVGENSAQSYQVLGMTGNLTLEQVEENGAQTVTWEYMLSGFETDLALTEQDPDEYIPVPIAGSELKISKTGSVLEPVSLCVARVGLTTNRELTPKICADDNETGLAGYVLNVQKAEIKVTVYDNADLPGGISLATYREVFLANDPDENKFQLLFSFGRQVHGAIFALYAAQAHIKSFPPPSDINGLGTQEITFGLTAGVANNLRALVA